MKIIKEELRFEENLKKRLEFICEFSMETTEQNKVALYLFNSVF